MRKRIIYSQNFLKDKKLVINLVEKSSITSSDLVIEIGAGSGIITQNLINKAGKVIAYEIDKNLYKKITSKFKNKKNLLLKQTDFLKQSLPKESYKIFANIPFSITASIIKKITQSNNPPQDTYLIVQKEAAKKFAGKPLDFKNSQISILLKPWFEFSIVYKFQRNEFIPKPNVDTVLLRISKRNNPLISNKNKPLYQDFVVYTFNQFKSNITEGLLKIFTTQTMIKLAKEFVFSTKAKPSELEFKIWLTLFNKLIKNPNKNIVRGSFVKLKKQEQRIEKINRTRKDTNWRTFKNKALHKSALPDEV